MDDAEDSRTATAGRKRDFQETASNEGSDTYNSDHEPSRKRMKDDGKLPGINHTETGSTIDLTTESPMPALADEAADHSRLPPVQGSIPNMLKEETNEEPPFSSAAANSSARPPTTWNTGVQSGLRTSFSFKPKGKAVTQNFENLVGSLDVDMGSVDSNIKEESSIKMENGFDANNLYGDSEMASRPRLGQSAMQEQSRTSDMSLKQRAEASNTQDRGYPNSSLQVEPHTLSGPEDEHDENSEDDEYGGYDDGDIYDANGNQISQAAQFVDADILAAAGPPPIPPPRFQVPTKNRKKKMSRTERRTYMNKVHAYVAALDRYRLAKRQYDAKLGIVYVSPTLPPDFATNPKRLPKREVAEMSARDQQAYSKVYGAHLKDKKIARKDKKHEQAESVLRQVKQWPLPAEYAQVTADMRKGKTWYPSRKYIEKNGIRPFTCSAGTFEIREIFDSDGLPINGQGLSFNHFVTWFLQWNRQKWNNMDQRVLKQSFVLYLSTFYAHAPPLVAQMRLTADRHDAIKLHAAIAQQQLDDGTEVSPSNLHPAELQQTSSRLEFTDIDAVMTETSSVQQPQRALVSDVENLQQDRHNAHNETVAIMQQCNQWPLPEQYRSVTDAIAQGKTFFPSLPTGKGPPEYRCMSRQFSLPEVIDNGFPVALQDLSIDKFARTFLSQSREDWHYLNDGRLKAAYKTYINKYYSKVLREHPDLRHLMDKPGSLTFEDAKQMLSSESSDKPPVEDFSTEQAGQEKLDVVMDATPSSRYSQPASNTTWAMVVDPATRHALMALQNKYYLGASDEVRCLTCARVGHLTETCPEMSCKTCGVQGQHSTAMCPRMPCGKCRSRGHSQNECREKLSMPRSEMRCDICGADNHLEIECHQIWRSYEPPQNAIRVSGIPVYCYACGEPDHYGPDCGMYHGVGVKDARYTFTGANLFKYLDIHSKRRALSAGVDYSLPPRPNTLPPKPSTRNSHTQHQHTNALPTKGPNIRMSGNQNPLATIPNGRTNMSYSIKGKANDPIVLSDGDEDDDDDESDEDFIRPSVLAGRDHNQRGQSPQAPFRFDQTAPPMPTSTQNRNRASHNRGAGSARGARGGGGGGGRVSGAPRGPKGSGHNVPNSNNAPKPKRVRKTPRPPRGRGAH